MRVALVCWHQQVSNFDYSCFLWNWIGSPWLKSQCPLFLRDSMPWLMTSKWMKTFTYVIVQRRTDGGRGHFLATRWAVAFSCEPIKAAWLMVCKANKLISNALLNDIFGTKRWPHLVNMTTWLTTASARSNLDTVCGIGLWVMKFIFNQALGAELLVWQPLRFLLTVRKVFCHEEFQAIA